MNNQQNVIRQLKKNHMHQQRTHLHWILHRKPTPLSATEAQSHWFLTVQMRASCLVRQNYESSSRRPRSHIFPFPPDSRSASNNAGPLLRAHRTAQTRFLYLYVCCFLHFYSFTSPCNFVRVVSCFSLNL